MNLDGEAVCVLPCEWWEISWTPDREVFALSFRMPSGTVMTFQVPRDGAINMRDSLTIGLGQLIHTPDGVTRQ